MEILYIFVVEVDLFIYLCIFLYEKQGVILMFVPVVMKYICQLKDYKDLRK